MYEIYFDDLLFPIAPTKIETKFKNQNKTIKLINGEEINFPQVSGLTVYEMELLIPNQKYPFATYNDGFKNAKVFIQKVTELKKSKKPFDLLIIRNTSAKELYHTEEKVTIEDYSTSEDAKNGTDVVLKITLKKYVNYGVKPLEIIEEEKVAKATPKRETGKSPEPKTEAKTYTVKSGDTLWAIAKFFYGNGSLYPKIFDANRDKIQNANLIYAGQVLIIPVL